jgi:Secretion system C-terminal sorting domain
VQNNTAADIDLYWERQNVQIPAAWRTTVCDLNLCWGEATNTQPFTLPPTPLHTDGELLEIQFRPNGVSGSGSCEVAVFNAASHLELVRGFYSASTVVGVIDISVVRFQVYPNPAVEYISLSGSQDAHTINIYSALGVLVKTFTVNSQTQQYNIADLQAGSYIIELRNQKNGVLQTSPIVKHF